MTARPGADSGRPEPDTPLQVPDSHAGPRPSWFVCLLVGWWRTFG